MPCFMLNFPVISYDAPRRETHVCIGPCFGSQALTIGGPPNSAKIYGMIHGLAVHYDW